MAYSLFVDSSDNLTLGFLDDNLEWLEFKRLPNKKSSGVFHGLVEELLSSHGKTLFDLDRVFYAAGPGSYTGVRLVEGFCQILRWRDIKTNSFYLFEIPSLLGIEKGTWFSEAYKGEAFIYSWNGTENDSKLVKKEDLDSSYDKNSKLISLGSFDGVETQSVLDLIREDSNKLFSTIIDKDLEREPFYYRTIENEFNKPKAIRGRP